MLQPQYANELLATTYNPKDKDQVVAERIGLPTPPFAFETPVPQDPGARLKSSSIRTPAVLESPFVVPAIDRNKAKREALGAGTGTFCVR